MTARTLLWVAGLAAQSLLLPGAARAQDGTLGQAVRAFTRAWVERDFDAIASSIAVAGLHVTLEGRDYHALESRQAVVTLRDFLDGRVESTLDVRRVSDLGGSPRRGFSDLAWSAVDERSGEQLRRTVFVSFVREDDVWRLEDLRVLR